MIKEINEKACGIWQTYLHDFSLHGIKIFYKDLIIDDKVTEEVADVEFLITTYAKMNRNNDRNV